MYVFNKLRGLTNYDPSHFYQIFGRDVKDLGISVPNIILIVQHPATFTGGRRFRNPGNKHDDSAGKLEDLAIKFDNDFNTGDISYKEAFRSVGAEYYSTLRGGKLTFHGPGQLVLYPLINIRNLKNPSIKCYIHDLEEVLIKSCANMGIASATRSENTGVWVGRNKIAAIGVHVSKRITSHGFALNVDTDLNWFNHIVPCGLSGTGVTSVNRELGLKRYSVDEAEKIVVDTFKRVFNVTQEPNQLLNQKLDDFIQEQLK